MRFFFGIFLWSIALWTFGDVLRKPPENRVYAIQYERLQDSPRGLAVNLFDRLNRMSRQLIPEKTVTRRSLTPIAEYASPESTVPCFAARKERGGRLYISVPGTIQGMIADRDSLALLCSWLLLARTGLDHTRGDFLRDSWIVAGMLRKTFQNMTPNKTPFSAYFPGAYALAKYGIYPSLKSVMNSRLSLADGAVKDFSDEYCELLLLACARANLYQTGFLSEWIGKNDGRTASAYQIFIQKTKQEIGDREKRLFGDGQIRSDEEKAEMWFRAELHRMLVQDTMPAASSRIETVFLENQYFHFIPKEKKEKITVGEKNKKFSRKDLKTKREEADKAEIQKLSLAEKLPLEEYPGRYGEMEDPERALDEAIARLMGVGRMISPDLVPVFVRFFHALNSFRNHHDPQTGEDFRKARQEFLHALEKHIVVERFLEKQEQELVSFPARYAVTLQVLEDWKRPDHVLMEKLARLLDQQAAKTGDR